MMLRPLREVFDELSDRRSRLGKRYTLTAVLTVIFLGILSGENSERGIADWAHEQRWALSHRLGTRGGRVPSLGTIQRVLRAVDETELERGLSRWIQPLISGSSDEDWPGIALDGKTLRGSTDETSPALHLLSAFSHHLEVVLAQRAVGNKTNEVPEARTILESLTLDGALLTLDAMHTQRETAQAILEKGGPI